MPSDARPRRLKPVADGEAPAASRSVVMADAPPSKPAAPVAGEIMAGGLGHQDKGEELP
jgi:hypothetical protein